MPDALSAPLLEQAAAAATTTRLVSDQAAPQRPQLTADVSPGDGMRMPRFVTGVGDRPTSHLRTSHRKRVASRKSPRGVPSSPQTRVVDASSTAVARGTVWLMSITAAGGKAGQACMQIIGMVGHVRPDHRARRYLPPHHLDYESSSSLSLSLSTSPADSSSSLLHAHEHGYTRNNGKYLCRGVPHLKRLHAGSSTVHRDDTPERTVRNTNITINTPRFRSAALDDHHTLGTLRLVWCQLKTHHYAITRRDLIPPLASIFIPETLFVRDC
ncbi:hypothetical protein DOTSEDRAFT_81336 [Dothistroma septosporum NZE10]|uniref:Uncharacterized protein n=1 Tax=Dothistroma septosporum (strain NZE10 / CBS 128990) TaxID=675120 RepID=N1PIM6_DOTSN|nr:hypothetical protein DOTSEDRAFT_81336 [Dothistroma septosporum NZE10]